MISIMANEKRDNKTFDETNFDDTSTRTGFDKLALCSLATLVVIVAEKRYVVRSFGMTFNILSMLAPKSRSSRRSASSRTFQIAVNKTEIDN